MLNKNAKAIQEEVVTFQQRILKQSAIHMWKKQFLIYTS